MKTSEKVLGYLADGGSVSSRDLATNLNIRHTTMTDVMTRLHRAGQVYVSGWTMHGNVKVKLYSLGDLDDVEKPSALSNMLKSEKRINDRLRSEGREPFDPANPRCDVAASWISAPAFAENMTEK